MNNYQLSVKKYPLYKDSAIAWLGDVPEYWELKRLKDLSKLIIDGTHFTPDYTSDGIHFLSVNDITRKIFDLNQSKFISPNAHKELIRRCYPKKGDILLSKNGTIGVPFLIDFDEEISIYVSLCLIKILPKVNAKYSYYSFLASFMFEQYNLHSKTNSVTNLHLDKLRNFLQLCPPLSEQNSIANYLDTKTAQCDRKIDLLTQKATQYGKLKQSLINETVTRGLDKSMPMKDSAIGEIPRHWEVKRIKEVSDINKRTLTDKTPDNYEFDYIDIGSVTYGVHGFSSERMTFDNSPSRARRIVKQGDTIISTVRTYLKAIASIDDEVSDLIVSTGFAVVSPKKSVFSKYFSYWLTANYTIDEICALSTGVSYPATNASAISNLFCLVPPISEQKAIADYLDTKTSQIDQIIQTINTQIEKLKELRKTLINDVVTGKIRV
jgi:type I restriction enzyme, S subunit